MQQKIMYLGIILVLFLFAGINAFVSQRFPSLIYRLGSLNNEDAANTTITKKTTSSANLKEIAQKIAQYEKLLSLNPKNPLVLSHLAQLYELKGNDQKAKELFRKAQEIDPWIK